MIDEGGRLEVFAERNLMPGSGQKQSLSMSSVRHVFDTGEAIWLTDTSTNEIIRSQKSVIDMQLKTIFCMPLSVNDKNIGVVYLDSRYIRQDPIDRNSFEAIVGLCAVAIERARLSEEGRRNSALASLPPLASNIANDFKNALLLIGGHAELLFNLCSDPEASFHIEQIQSAVARLAAMSSQIAKKRAAKGAVKVTASNAASLQTTKKRAAKAARSSRASSSAKGKH
jgi:GAF domain-containing protein